ncbi:hypothetical protein GCM10028807_57830 [Spirosoma daeguense]
MNKLSGYKLFRLDDGTEVEMKFSNGTYALFAELIGVDEVEGLEKSIQVPTKEVDGAIVPNLTFAFLKNFRLFVLAAIRYAALAQGKSDNFNEWQVQEWIDEIGIEKIFAIIEKAPEDPKKKQGKAQVRASQ